MVAETTERVAEPRDATEVVAEQETAEPRDSRKGSVKIARQPRPPVTGAGGNKERINMDTRTGEIVPMKEFEKRRVNKKFLKLFDDDAATNPILFEFLSPRVRKMVTETGKGWVSRNSKCPCGSGKRFKACCMTKR